MNPLKSLTVAVIAAASIAVAAPPKFATPILLTSCGQSADAMSAKVLLQRDSLAFDYAPQATADQLAGHASVIIVVGGSSKGLGAAKISAEDETARVTRIIDAAESAKLPILVLHLGGVSRRGSLSDSFNQLGADHADHIIVVKGGNDDGFFTEIAEAKQITIETYDKILDVAPALKLLYATGE
jgi:hypothetical protein